MGKYGPVVELKTSDFELNQLKTRTHWLTDLILVIWLFFSFSIAPWSGDLRQSVNSH